MGSVPTPRTFVAGEIETAAYLNSLGAVLTFMQNPPRVKAIATAAQSIPNASYTALTFGGESWDTDGMHSTVTNTSRLTAATPGLYHVMGMVPFVANATGRRYAIVQKNGVGGATDDTVNIVAVSSTTTSSTPLVNREIYLAAGDYIELLVYQDSGGALSTSNATLVVAWFSARWVAVS